uniref:Uncharacterized protein n=1 Tax=Anopheles dirus TaxID=7168 RepID=A0A182NVV2_9DIPT
MRSFTHFNPNRTFKDTCLHLVCGRNGEWARAVSGCESTFSIARYEVHKQRGEKSARIYNGLRKKYSQARWRGYVLETHKTTYQPVLQMILRWHQ